MYHKNTDVKVKVAQLCPALCDPMDYIAHGILQARMLECIAFPFSRGSSQPRSPTLQADSLPAKPQGKPKNTGVRSLSLLQQIFPTQKSNRSLLHCRRILYQLSYQRSPVHYKVLLKTSRCETHPCSRLPYKEPPGPKSSGMTVEAGQHLEE